jgi:hypothetical protein
MRTPGWALVFGAVTLMAMSSPRSANSQDSTAALVVEIRGTVHLRTSATAAPVALDPGSDVGRVLYVGHQVRCAPGGVLRLLQMGGGRAISCSATWYTIRPGSSARSREVRDLLDSYGRLGGRDRADPSRVFSPSPHSVVTPADFTIRWNQGPAIRTIRVIVQEPDGKEVWRQDSVDGASRSLESDAARQALATYRSQSGTGPLVLRLIDSDGNATDVSFSLISTSGEQSLRKDLSHWDRDTVTLVSHLGRASVFESARMFAAAADEFEAALEVAPASRDLLVRTILAHRRTGNVDRAAELTKRLPEGATAP